MTDIDTNLLISAASIENSNVPYLKILIGNNDITSIYDVNLQKLNESILNQNRAQEYSDKSLSFLIEAIRNLIRKVNITELNEALDDNEISEDQYYDYLKKDSYKYTIKLKDISSPIDALIIRDLVKKIGFELRDFTASEVSEMFSIKEGQLISSLKSLHIRSY